MPWKLEEAKQKFFELLNAVVKEPQLIYDDNQLVAVVVKAEVFQEFLTQVTRSHLCKLNGIVKI